jgi:hypothetical protein
MTGGEYRFLKRQILQLFYNLLWLLIMLSPDTKMPSQRQRAPQRSRRRTGTANQDAVFHPFPLDRLVHCRIFAAWARVGLATTCADG